MKRFPILAALAALATASTIPAEAQRRAAVRPAPARAVDWLRTVVATPEGGYRMGNPAARVKLVEYGSISCPHCAAFAREATASLNAYVRSGRVSWEYRPFMLFPTDPSLFALLTCQGPSGFFGAIEQLYRTQPDWAERARAYIEANEARLQAMNPVQRGQALMRAAQLDRFFVARGMTAARFNVCLASPANQQRIAEITRRAQQRDGVRGTPTFFINGVHAEVGGWTELEPLLRQRLGS
jgi:protein-disulfide isomerase